MRKFLPYILIVITLTGFFSSTTQVGAQTTLNEGTCFSRSFEKLNGVVKENCGSPTNDGARWVDAGQVPPWMATHQCHESATATNYMDQATCGLNSGYQWIPYGGTYGQNQEEKQLTAYDNCVTQNSSVSDPQKLYDICGGLSGAPSRPQTKTSLETELGKKGVFDGIFLNIIYILFYTLPRFLFYLVARLFNAMAFYTLNSDLYGAFIGSAWAVVRDISNIFFILTLLYIAIKMILGLGGAEIKKMVVSVIIAALLINFSMFMSKVVIDSANILALIFYNKISTVVINKSNTPQTTEQPGTTDINDPRKKDIAGALTNNIDPTRNLNDEFFDKLKSNKDEFNKAQGAGGGLATSILAGGAGGLIGGPVGAGIGAALGGLTYFYWGQVTEQTVPLSMLTGIIIASGLVYAVAAYVFFKSGFALLGRLVELWLLIIFSPFAFMSLSIPELKKMDWVGWDAWSKRLISTAFMAPIFMFFLYVIFKIVQAKPFESIVGGKPWAQQDWAESLLLLIIPMSMIILMLLKALKFAEEGSGEVGKVISKYAGVAVGAVGGLALGAATGGASMALSGTVGNLASKISNSEGLIDLSAKKGMAGFAARKILSAADYGKGASFDLRKAPGFGTLAGKTGINSSLLNMGVKNTEGGFEAREAQKEKKARERFEQLKVRKNEPLQQKLKVAEVTLQKAMNRAAEDFERIDNDLKDLAEAKSRTATGSKEEKDISVKMQALAEEKKGIKEGYIQVSGGGYATDNGLISHNATSLTAGQLAIAQARHAVASSDVVRRQSELIALQSSGTATPIEISSAMAEVDKALQEEANKDSLRAIAESHNVRAIADAVRGTGTSIKILNQDVKGKGRDITNKNRQRARLYGNYLTTPFGGIGQGTSLGRLLGAGQANQNAAHAIIMENKLDEKGH